MLSSPAAGQRACLESETRHCQTGWTFGELYQTASFAAIKAISDQALSFRASAIQLAP